MVHSSSSPLNTFAYTSFSHTDLNKSSRLKAEQITVRI